MDSGKRVSISFKTSRLIRLIEGPTSFPSSETMTKKAAAAPEGAAAAAAATAAEAVDAAGAAGEAAAVDAGRASPPFTTVTSKKKSADIRNFLQAAAGGQTPNARTPSKRGRVEGSTPPRDKPEAKRMTQACSDDEEAFEDAQGDLDSKLEEMKRKLLERAGLSPQQAQLAMEIIRADLQDIIKAVTREVVATAAKEATKTATQAVKETVNRQMEADRCRRSVVIHNANRWVGNYDNGYGLAENITAQIHRCMAHTVLVLDAFTIGQWINGREPTSVFVTFGSVAQKGTFFRVLARVIGEKKEGWEMLRGISCRDAFPREHMEESRSLAQKGFSLRNNGQAAAFRVVARGPACIPVLEIKARLANNGRGRWEVYRERERRPVVAMPGGGSRQWRWRWRPGMEGRPSAAGGPPPGSPWAMTTSSPAG